MPIAALRPGATGSAKIALTIEPTTDQEASIR
jgi:hypothetical protein